MSKQKSSNTIHLKEWTKYLAGNKTTWPTDKTRIRTDDIFELLIISNNKKRIVESLEFNESADDDFRWGIKESPEYKVTYWRYKHLMSTTDKSIDDKPKICSLCRKLAHPYRPGYHIHINLLPFCSEECLVYYYHFARAWDSWLQCEVCGVLLPDENMTVVHVKNNVAGSILVCDNCKYEDELGRITVLRDTFGNSAPHSNTDFPPERIIHEPIRYDGNIIPVISQRRKI